MMRPMSRPVLIILISAFVMLGPFTNNIMVPSLTSIATEMQTGFGDAQTILSIFMVGFAAGQLFVGPMSDRFGRKPVLTVSMALLGNASYNRGYVVFLSFSGIWSVFDHLQYVICLLLLLSGRTYFQVHRTDEVRTKVQVSPVGRQLSCAFKSGSICPGIFHSQRTRRLDLV